MGSPSVHIMAEIYHIEAVRALDLPIVGITISWFIA